MRPETGTAATGNETTEHVRSETAQADGAGMNLELSMVVYESCKRGAGEGSKAAWMAIPLSAVERIERVPPNKIEYAGGRAVLQYDGELLPLEDADALLADLQVAAGAMVTVLVCRRPGAHAALRAGIVVRRVLDVSAGALLAPQGEWSGSQLALVQDRIATIPREFAGPVGGSAALQEVA